MFGKQSKVPGWTYIACIIAFSHQFFVDVEGIRPGKFVSNELQSSPSQITAMKKSSVWLHWNYTYGGDYLNALVYQYQSITYTNSLGSTPVELARRTGPSGTLYKVSSISDPISTRIDVISNNSTLVVQNLQFNDSGSNFSSFLTMAYGSSSRRVLVDEPLRPVVTIDVKGVPEFTLPPPTAVTVSEKSTLMFKVQMEGSPKPSAMFQWPHDSSKDGTIIGTKLYPYIYESTYTLNSIPASFCGKILNSKVTNSIGTSAAISTNVTVLPNLDAVPNPKAGKPSTGCVRVIWNKIESGDCLVKYEVKFKDNSGSVIYTNDGTNIGEVRQCSIPTNVNITKVQLTISFSSVAKNFTSKVSEGAIPTTPAPTTIPKTTESTQAMLKSSTKSGGGTKSSTKHTTKPPPTTKSGGGGGGTTSSNTGAIVGGVIGGIVLLIIIALLIFFLCKKKTCCKNDEEQSQGDSGYKMEPANEYSVVHRKNSAEERNPVYESANNPQVIYQQAIRPPGMKPHKSKPREPSDYAEVKVDEHGYPAVGAFSHSETEGYVGRGNTGGHRGERDSGRRVAPERRPPPPYNDGRNPYHQDELVQENPLYESADIRR